MEKIMLIAVRVKDLKWGEFFTRKPVENPTEKQVYLRGDYDRSDKRYYCPKFDDICIARGFKGDTIVYTGFTF